MFLQRSWFLSSYTWKFCTAYYFSRFGVESLKRLVMNTFTLTELDTPTLGHKSNPMQGASVVDPSMHGLMSHMLSGSSMLVGRHSCNVHFSTFTLDPLHFYLIF
jgi:hypothetical protein